MRRLIKHQLMRFLVVGVMNTGFSYLIYAMFLQAGLNFALANFFSMVCSILFSFKTQGRLVFANAENRLFKRYIVSWSCLYLFNITIIYLLGRAGVNPYLGGALALAPVIAMSYFLQKLWVFNAS